jgi:hypothetical protein
VAKLRLRPLVEVGTSVLGYSRGHLVLLDCSLWETVRVCRLPGSRMHRLLRRSRLLRRLLRLEPTDAVCLDAENILLLMRREVLLLDLRTCTVSVDFVFPKNRHALSLSRVEGLRAFADGVYFGEYVGNLEMASVAVWRRDLKEPDWQRVFEFPSNTINHIHSVVPDFQNDRLWILTGDFGVAAAIWVVTSAWESVERVVGDDQLFRACWLWPSKGFMLYATDTQIASNHLVRLRIESTSVSQEVLAPVPGPSIYGCEVGSSFVFSTVVEPSFPNPGVVPYLLSRKRAACIRSNESLIFQLRQDGSLQELFRAPKDMWPSALMQFGTFHLLRIGNDKICAYAVGVKELDGNAIVLEVDCA